MFKKDFFVRLMWMILCVVGCMHAFAADDAPFFENGKVTLENSQTKKRLELCANPLKFRHLNVGANFIPALRSIKFSENTPSSRFLLLMHGWGTTHSQAMSGDKRNYIVSLFHQYHNQNHRPVTLFDAFGTMMLHKRYYSKQWHQYRGNYRKNVEQLLDIYERHDKKPTLILRELAIDVIDEHQKNKTLTKDILKTNLKILHDVGQRGDAIASLYFAKFSLNQSFQGYVNLSREEKNQYIELLKYVFSLPVAPSHHKDLLDLTLSPYERMAIHDVADTYHSQKYAQGRYKGFVAFMNTFAFPSHL